MALARIIDLEERRRSKQITVAGPATVPPMWCYVWMPVYFWYMP